MTDDSGEGDRRADAVAEEAVRQSDYDLALDAEAAQARFDSVLQDAETVRDVTFTELLNAEVLMLDSALTRAEQARMEDAPQQAEFLNACQRELREQAPDVIEPLEELSEVANEQRRREMRERQEGFIPTLKRFLSSPYSRYGLFGAEWRWQDTVWAMGFVMLLTQLFVAAINLLGLAGLSVPATTSTAVGALAMGSAVMIAFVVGGVTAARYGFADVTDDLGGD